MVGRKLAEFPRGTIADFEAAVAEFLDPLPEGVRIGVESWLGVLAQRPHRAHPEQAGAAQQAADPDRRAYPRGELALQGRCAGHGFSGHGFP